MAKATVKVDKRSKAYRDSNKKVWQKSTPISSTLVATYTASIDPIKEPQTIYQQLQELKQDSKNLWVTVAVLQEQVKNLETKVG